MKSGSLDCLKYLMFFFNLLFFICGLAALALGIWALVNEQAFKKILVDNTIIFDGVYVIIGIGACLFLIGFLGCCGAVKENRCMLGTFFVVVLVIFLAQIAAAILIFVKRSDVATYVTESMSKYGMDGASGEAITQGWDTLQNTAACCGYTNYSDWKNNTAWAERYPMKLVPDSCCTRDMTSKNSSIINETLCQLGMSDYLNKVGCIQRLGGSLHIVGILAGTVLLVELLGMIFACCLYRHVGEYGTVA